MEKSFRFGYSRECRTDLIEHKRNALPTKYHFLLSKKCYLILAKSGTCSGDNGCRTPGEDTCTVDYDCPGKEKCCPGICRRCLATKTGQLDTSIPSFLPSFLLSFFPFLFHFLFSFLLLCSFPFYSSFLLLFPF